MPETLIEQLERLIDEKIRVISISDRLWNLEDIAIFLNRSKAHVVNVISKQPGFPMAIRLSRNDKPLYDPKDVKRWVLSHKEKTAA